MKTLLLLPLRALATVLAFIGMVLTFLGLAILGCVRMVCARD